MRVETPSCRLVSRALTHVGYVRERNEDATLDMPETGLWAVADGMGGHADGAYASQAVVQALRRLGSKCSGRRLVRGVAAELQHVNDQLLARANQLGPTQVVGSTVIVLILEGEHFHCFWAGDSRLYLWRAGGLQRMTRDHALDDGQERRGLTRAVGAAAVLELDYIQGHLYEQDLFLLCSDGLNKKIDDNLLAAMLDEYPPEAAGATLLEAALARGGADNISCITVYLDTCFTAGSL